MLRHSGAKEKNPRVADWTSGYADKDNVEFFRDALSEVASNAERGNDGFMAIGLLGQRDIPGVTLRRAQAVLRWDLRPSLWSHAFVVADRFSDGADVAELAIREVSIYSRTGEFPEPADNAVSSGRLGLYRRPELDANVALVVIEMGDEDVEKVAERAVREPNLDRLRYDLWETLGVWSGYLWAAGTRPNPLREGFPVFSSAFVEYCYEAILLDLSPAASERNSAPEHLWNSAVWWHDAFEELKHPISGYACLRDPGCSLLDAGERRTLLPA